MKKINFGTLFLCITLLFGCTVSNTSSTNQTSTSVNLQTFTSEDGKVSIKTPYNWKNTDATFGGVSSGDKVVLSIIKNEVLPSAQKDTLSRENSSSTDPSTLKRKIGGIGIIEISPTNETPTNLKDFSSYFFEKFLRTIWAIRNYSRDNIADFKEKENIRMNQRGQRHIEAHEDVTINGYPAERVYFKLSDDYYTEGYIYIIDTGNTFYVIFSAAGIPYKDDSFTFIDQTLLELDAIVKTFIRNK